MLTGGTLQAGGKRTSAEVCWASEWAWELAARVAAGLRGDFPAR